MLGTASEYHGWNDLPVSSETILEVGDNLGDEQTWPHYAVGWALAMDTPYQWMKQIASHYGGARNGLLVSWPDGISARNEIRQQWHHVNDILPTLLETCEQEAPEYIDGVRQDPFDGVSMAYSFDDPAAPGRHRVQYFEIGGSRAIYEDGWVACTVHRETPWDLLSATPPAFADDRWELYDTETDWSQAVDLSDAEPERLARLQALFRREAERNQVFPLDDSAMAVRRNSSARARSEDMWFGGGAQRLPHDAIPNTIGNSFTIEVNVSMNAAPEGVLCVQGGRFTGYALYFSKDGRLNFCYNVGNRVFSYVRSAEPVSSSVRTLRFEFEAERPALGSGGQGRLFADGAPVGSGSISRTASFMFPAGEDFSVGSDPLTPVTDEYEIFDNAFNGTILSARLRLDSTRSFSDRTKRAMEEAVQ